jgi:hypothetical protein
MRETDSKKPMTKQEGIARVMKKILLAGLMLMALCRPSSAETEAIGFPTTNVDPQACIDAMNKQFASCRVAKGEKCFDFMFNLFENCEFKAPVERRVKEWRDDFYTTYAVYKRPGKANAQKAIGLCELLSVYCEGTMQQQGRIENDFNCNVCGARAMLYFLCGACYYKLAVTMPEGEAKEEQLQHADELQTKACDEWARNIERNGSDELKATSKFRVFMKMVNAH